MKKRLLAVGVTAPLIFGFGLAGTAMAQSTLTECQPSDAWIETSDWVLESPGEGWVQVDERIVVDQEAVEEIIATEWLWMLETQHFEYLWMSWVIDTPAQPAQGEPTIEVPNPDYVPEQTIEHPAVYDYIEHPAEYEDQVVKVEYKKWKIFWWDYKWFPVAAQPDAHSGWVKTGEVKTESVLVKEAWTEEVLVEEAWTETIPAVGSPTITVDNPDYVPAQDEVGHWDYQWSEESPGEGWIKTGKTPRQIDSTWEYQWAAEQPGDAWVKSSKSREVVVQEGQDEVTHTEYQFAFEHEAVTCPPEETPTTPEEPTEPEPTTPTEEPTAEEPDTPNTPDEEEPTVTPQARQRTVTPQAEAPAEVDELAHTGAEQHTGAITLAALLGLSGGSLAILRRHLARR